MNYNLPEAPVPIGTYVTLRILDSLIFTSGHIPLTNDFPDQYIGKIGKDLSSEIGNEASALVCDLTIATLLHNNIDLDYLTPVNVVGYVNAVDSFEDHADILNGFTDKLREYLPARGLPTRSAIGVASLPKNVCVEIQAIFGLISKT